MSLKEKLSQLKQRLKNVFGRSERAVSPVIGVILMVAITVILAAVIGAFVLGLGPGAEPAPSATLSLEWDDDATEVIIVHNGGDELDLEEFSIVDVEAGTDEVVGGNVSAGAIASTPITNEPQGVVNLRHDPSGSIIASEDFS